MNSVSPPTSLPFVPLLQRADRSTVRLELSLFQSVDVRIKRIEHIRQRQGGGDRRSLLLTAYRWRGRRRGCQPQDRRMLVGILSLKDENGSISHLGVTDDRIGLVAGVKKQLPQLVGGRDDLVRRDLRVDRRTP